MESIKKEIGSSKHPTVFELQEYKGNRFLSIREYYFDKDNIKKPGKKGYTLNKFKLLELISFINDNNTAIKEFLNSSEESFEIELKYDSLFGRNFNIEYSNGETSLILDNSLRDKFSDDQLLILKKSIFGIYESLLSVFDVDEDKEEIETVLNYFSNKINRM